jgi:5'-nucleotidase
MRLLLTNDDGFGAEGIEALAEALSPAHEVWIIAPERDRSACSHSMTIKGHVRLETRGERRFACSGSPVDCVILGHLGAVKGQIDAVLSGINRGTNIGTDLLYSGTAAAARQATLYGVPALALSLAQRSGRFDYRPSASYVASRLPELLARWSRDAFVNLNFPPKALEGDWVETGLCARGYKERLTVLPAPDGSDYCFFGDCDIHTLGDSGACEDPTDSSAIDSGLVSLSRVLVQPLALRPEAVVAGARGSSNG